MICVYHSSTYFFPLNNMSGRTTSIYTYAILSWNCCLMFCCMEGLCLLNQLTIDGHSNCFQFLLLNDWNEHRQADLLVYFDMCPFQGTDSHLFLSVTLLRNTFHSNSQPGSHCRPQGLEPLKSYLKLSTRASASVGYCGRGSITLRGLQVFEGPPKS